jgi:hypothetical protein
MKVGYSWSGNFGRNAIGRIAGGSEAPPAISSQIIEELYGTKRASQAAH